MKSVSLLVSPEGWLVPLWSVEEAEEGSLSEPPWVWVKTQFAPIEKHVRLLELLEALRDELIPNLEIVDERRIARPATTPS